MSLQKVNYISGETIITADNLNNIQDTIISNENILTNVKNTLDTKTRFVEEITLTAAGWSNLTQSVILKNSLLETDTPHICLSTVTSDTVAQYSKIACAETVSDNGIIKLKFTCLEDVPEINLVLQVEVIR